MKRGGRMVIPFVAILILALITLFPIYVLVIASLRPVSEIMRHGLGLSNLLPNYILFDNYKLLFSRDVLFFQWFGNSVLITGIGTITTTMLSAMVGYGLAVYQFSLRNTIFTIVLFVMMIPLQILILPMFRMFTGLGLMNSYAGILLPTIMSPFAIFFFRQYASGLPKDFMDAGRIDGCTELGIYFRIMMPLMKPSFGAIVILQGIGYWNDYIWPMIVINQMKKFTIPVGLASLMTPFGNNYNVLYPGAVLAVIPIIVLFLVFQKDFINGMVSGGVKG